MQELFYRLINFVSISVVLLIVFCSTVRPQSAGVPRFVVRTDPQWDAFTSNPSDELKSWFRTRVWRMMVYSSYWDNKLAWYPNAWVYVNLYAIPTKSELVMEHPEWILKDRNGNRLYIPYACSSGTCPQYAGDVSNPEFRRDWLRRATALQDRGYRGFFVDDVNLEFRVSDGFGHEESPFDKATRESMTYEAWKRNIAEFVEQIRRTFPNLEIVHNAIWYAGGSQRDADPYVQREIRAANYINIERGITDKGLTGGAGVWSVDAILGYIDRVHRLGPGVIIDNLGGDIEYCLATYFLISTGRDAVGNHMIFPQKWPEQLQVDMGVPLESRQAWHELIRRVFSNGVAIVSPPGKLKLKLGPTSGFREADGTPAPPELTLPSPGGTVLIAPVKKNRLLIDALKIKTQ